MTTTPTLERTSPMPITDTPENARNLIDLEPVGPVERRRLRILAVVFALGALALIGAAVILPAEAERPTLEPTSTTTGKGTNGDLAPAGAAVVEDAPAEVEVELIPPATTIAVDEPVAEDAPAPTNVPGATAPPKVTTTVAPSTTTSTTPAPTTVPVTAPPPPLLAPIGDEAGQ
jgi:hypothetical protein